MKLLFHCRPDPEDLACGGVKMPQLLRGEHLQSGRGRLLSPSHLLILTGPWAALCSCPIWLCNVTSRPCCRAHRPANLLPPSHPVTSPKSLQERLCWHLSHHWPPNWPLTASDVSIGQGTAVESPIPLASEPILLSACNNLLPGDTIQIQGTRMSRGARPQLLREHLSIPLFEVGGGGPAFLALVPVVTTTAASLRRAPVLHWGRKHFPEEQPTALEWC